MTDRELLELAAKAAGIELDFDHDLWHRAQVVKDGVIGSVWNPLTDDGDALRLAVKLGMDLLFGGGEIEVAATQHPRETDQEITYPWAWEKLGTDPYAATRRAIVRAAAQIGRTMK